jgi:hypothetical protein
VLDDTLTDGICFGAGTEMDGDVATGEASWLVFPKLLEAIQRQSRWAWVDEHVILWALARQGPLPPTWLRKYIRIGAGGGDAHAISTTSVRIRLLGDADEAVEAFVMEDVQRNAAGGCDGDVFFRAGIPLS